MPNMCTKARMFVRMHICFVWMLHECSFVCQLLDTMWAFFVIILVQSTYSLLSSFLRYYARFASPIDVLCLCTKKSCTNLAHFWRKKVEFRFNIWGESRRHDLWETGCFIVRLIRDTRKAWRHVNSMARIYHHVHQCHPILLSSWTKCFLLNEQPNFHDKFWVPSLSHELLEIVYSINCYKIWYFTLYRCDSW